MRASSSRRSGYAKAAIVELDYAVAPETIEHAIDVDEGQSRRITDVFLRQRKPHLLALAAGPLGPAPDEQFEDHAGDSLAGVAAAVCDLIVDSGIDQLTFAISIPLRLPAR